MADLDLEALTIEELAARLHTTPRTLYRRVFREVPIPFFMVGSRKRFSLAAVLAVLPAGRTGPPGRAMGSGQGARDLVSDLKRLVPRGWWVPRLVKGGR